jgi:hypothetical protein
MTIDRLRHVARAIPFKPFTLSLTDGRRFRVRSPEFIMITPEASRTVVVAESGEDYSIVDLLLVTSIDFGKAQRRPRPNGRLRRR